MSQNKIIRVILFLIIFIAVVHITANEFHLYFELWWLDVLTHFLGGLWASLFIIFTLFFSGIFNFKEEKKLFVFLTTAVFTSIFVGILWEIFELKSGITYISANYWPDTLSDIVFDTLGGLWAAIYSFRLFKNRNIQVNNISSQ